MKDCLYIPKTKKWTKRKFAQGGEFGNWIRSLRYDEKKNRLWIGRFRNVTVFDVKANKFTDYNRVINSDEKTNNFNTIAFDSDSVVWFGVESGCTNLNQRKIDDQTAWNYFKNSGRNFNQEGSSVSVSDFVFQIKKCGLVQMSLSQKKNLNIILAAFTFGIENLDGIESLKQTDSEVMVFTV